MYSELYLRLEPLGLERVAAAVRAAGHDVQLLDLQIFTHDDHRRAVTYEMKPPKSAVAKPNPAELFVHLPQGFRGKTATPAAR